MVQYETEGAKSTDKILTRTYILKGVDDCWNVFIKKSLNEGEKSIKGSERRHKLIMNDQKRMKISFWIVMKLTEEKIQKVQDIRTEKRDELAMIRGKVEYKRLMYTSVDGIISKKLKLLDFKKDIILEIASLTETKIAKDDILMIIDYNVLR